MKKVKVSGAEVSLYTMLIICLLSFLFVDKLRAQESIGNSDQAQLEDLLDLLANELGISRYSVVSEPERMLQAVTQTGQDAPTAEKIWDSSWSKTTPKIAECLENGGAVAFSFYHKGSRGNGTHIVSVLEVRGDELIQPSSVETEAGWP